MAKRPRVTPIERLQIMFGCGNDTAYSKGNGSGTPGLFPAWNRKWVEPIPPGPMTSPQQWQITAAGRDALAESYRASRAGR